MVLLRDFRPGMKLGVHAAFHHLDIDDLVISVFPAVIQRLRRVILLRRITPPEPVAVDEDDSASERADHQRTGDHGS